MKLCKNCDHYEVLVGGRSACTRMGSQEQCPVTGYDKIGGMLNPYQERSESGGLWS